MKTKAISIFSLFATVIFYGSTCLAQSDLPQARTPPSGLRPPRSEGIPVVAANGQGRMVHFRHGTKLADQIDTWECGQPVIARKFPMGGNYIRIEFSVGRPLSGPVAGSWTINTNATKDTYMLDGIFTSATFGTREGGLRPGGYFDLRGITTFIASGVCPEKLSSRPDPSLYTIRIWGVYGEERINFEITERSTGAVISKITFSDQILLSCGEDYSSNINTDLNSHWP